MNKFLFHRFNNDSILISDSKNQYYLTKDNELSIEKNNSKSLVNVYFNYYKSPNEKRNQEISYCLNKLITNTKINNIYLLCSDKYVDKSDKKITQINMIGYQPTFNDIFNIVNLNTKNEDLNIILNSDCFFNEESIELILKNIGHRILYCLSRWDVSKTSPFKATHFDVEFCQNSWCFLGKMTELDCNFKMTTSNYDNVLAYEFDKFYIVSNPSKEIKLYHYHISEKIEKSKNTLPETYKYIPSSYLKNQTKSYLNKFVNQIYVINLERRKDRLEHIKYEFEKFNIDFKRFDAIDGKKLGDDLRSSQLGCLRSHIGVIKDALEKGYDKIAVFEDDIILCGDFEKRFDYYSKSIPDNWDIMYLGGANFNTGTEIKPFIYKIDGIYGAFAMILNNHNDIFEKIIELSKLEDLPIDEYYCKMLNKYNIYIFTPFFVKTLKTTSDISENNHEFSYENEVDVNFKNTIDFSCNYQNHIQDIKPIETKNILNKFVDNIYCINLEKRKDKRIHIINEFNKLNLDSFKIIKGIDGQKLKIKTSEQRKGEIGCLRSHVSILQDAINNGYDKIAIFEDDIIFCDDFEKRFDYYSQNIPENWDIMYLGSDIPPILTPVTMIKHMIYRVWKSTGCFALILNNKNGIFQKIIDISNDEENPIDIYIETLFPKINAYIFIPFFVKLLDTQSDISNKNINNINSKYKDTIQVVNIEPKQQFIEHIKTEKEIFEEYIKLNSKFIIKQGTNVIFDSDTFGYDNINLFHDHFEIYGKPFSYRGIFIQKK